MAQNRTSYRNILTRGLSAIALFAMCGFGVVGTSASCWAHPARLPLPMAAEVMAAAAVMVAVADFHGGGFHGGGFRGWRLWFRLLGPGI